MTSLITLLHLDFHAFKDYLRQSTLTKLIIMGGFGVVVLGIYLVIAGLGLAFFYNLAGYQPFGRLTISYIFNTAIVVLFWLAIGSSLIAYLNSIMNTHPNLNYLMVLGIRPSSLVAWVELKHLLTNIFLVGLFLSPIKLAYDYIFSQQINLINQLVVLLISFGVASLSQALGSILGAFLAPVLHQKNRWLVLGVTALIFLLSAVSLTSILLPSSLRTLYYSQPDEFATIYNQLPLNHPLSPSRVLAANLTTGLNISGFLLVLAGVVSFGISLKVLSDKYTSLFQLMQVHLNATKTYIWATITPQTRYPLVNTWLLSILRDAKEFGYLVFFVLLSSIFFTLLNRSYFVRDFENEWLLELFTISLVWLLFITTAYSLRLIFPLASKLKQQAWLLRPQPQPRSYLFQPLLMSALILSLPLLLIALLVWFTLPLPITWAVIGVSVSWLLILAVVTLNLFLGCIQPDFEHSNQPELVSTSGLGLVSLSWSLGLVGLSSGLVYLGINGTFTLTTSLSLVLVVCATSVLMVSPIARYQIGKYQF